MMWLKIAWGLISGNLGTITTAITGVLGKISDNETARVVAQLNTSAAIWKDRVDLLKGLKITGWLVGAALIPPIYHQALVYFDSCPFFIIPYFAHEQGSWKVAQAPGIYAERESILIMSLLGIQSAVGVGIGALKIFGGRS
jgi:hypothetical protein